MKSWEFYDCIKHKDFSDWIIKTDVYVVGLWFLVCRGLWQLRIILWVGSVWWWLVSFSFWSSSWVSSEQMGRDILFQVTKGNLIVWFLQQVNSIRGHESLPLVQRTYFRRRSYLDLKQFKRLQSKWKWQLFCSCMQM